MMKAYTIADLIDNLNLDITALKAGRNKIDNMVYGAGIIENPDYYDWFSAGDFILTTGYIFKDDTALQKKLVKELAEQNCSGLGIKLRKYWNEIPQTILDEANLRGLPIVEIPFTYSLSQVSKKINYEISSKEDSMLHKFKNIHDAFSKCSINGGDLWQISKLTSELIGNPIVILDSRFNLLSYSEV